MNANNQLNEKTLDFGALIELDDSELERISGGRMNPLEDAMIALRPTFPVLP
jgi:hypothetical protein